VLISHKGTVGEVALVPNQFPEIVLTPQITYYRVRSGGRLDAGYLFSVVSSHAFLSRFRSLAAQSTRDYLGITQQKKLEIWLPPLAEQKRIADILSTWDKAIETTENLLANAEKQKRALMQQLLTGGRRLKGSEGEWNHVSLNTVFERVTRKNTQGNQNVLTISGRDGVISQRMYFNKLVAAADTSGYTLLRGSEFAYNKSYSAGYPLGAIKMLHPEVTGILSSLYICFRLRDKTKDCADFFRHWFEFGGLNRELSVVAQEGARNHGLLNVGISDFFGLRIVRPGVDEQREIADTLNLAEANVRALEDQREVLRREKHALMQQLLTGKRRVI